jgi:hypothetical protein
MKRRPAKQRVTRAFDIVKTVGLTLPHVEATTKYDGSPVLKVDGIFMAGLAMHPSAEPDTLVVRAGFEDRERLVEDAPETYYLTDYYRSYPLVLVRLSRVGPDALRDLLSVSWRMATVKARKRRPPRACSERSRRDGESSRLVILARSRTKVGPPAWH